MSSNRVFNPDLLAPYLALPQGDKVQAECSSFLLPSYNPNSFPTSLARCLDRRQWGAAFKNHGQCLLRRIYTSPVHLRKLVHPTFFSRLSARRLLTSASSVSGISTVL